MMTAVSDYFRTLAERFGEGWNRFWFTPSDPYTLSLVRVLVGALALYLHLTLTPDLVRLLADDGLLPVATVQYWTQAAFYQRPSLLNYFTDPAGLWFIHTIGAVVLALLTIGLWSRVMAVASLVVVLSYVHRAPMLAAEVEFVLSMLLFYLCLGPCGAYLSVDRWLKLRRTAALPPAAQEHAQRVTPSYWATLAIRLIQVHMAIVYFMGAISKIYGPVWWSGEAVWWMMARPESRYVDLTGLLHAHPYLVNGLTHAVMLFELAFAILIWNRTARPLLIALAVVLWLVTGFATGMMPFAVAMIIGSLAFASPEGLKSLLGFKETITATSRPAPTDPQRQPLQVG